MEALPRSSVSFRRQGSSGLVWDDNQMLQKQEGRAEFREPRPCHSAKPIGMNKADFSELRPCRSAKPVGLKVHSNSNAALTIYPCSYYSPAKKPHSFKSKFLKMFSAFFRKSATVRKFNPRKEMEDAKEEGDSNFDLKRARNYSLSLELQAPTRYELW